MPDIATSNTLLGLFGPMATLAVLGLNAILVWSRRHSFADALLGRGFATQVRFSVPPGESVQIGANVVPFGRAQPVRRVAPVVQDPVVQLAA